MNHRQKLVELRDDALERADAFNSVAEALEPGVQARVSRATSGVWQQVAQDVDAILADWPEDCSVARITRTEREPFTVDPEDER